MTSLTTLLTNLSKRRSLRWNSLQRQIEDVIQVDQLKETNNGSLSWALPHSGLNLNETKLNKSILEKKWSLKALYLRTYCDRVVIFFCSLAHICLGKSFFSLIFLEIRLFLSQKVHFSFRFFSFCLFLCHFCPNFGLTVNLMSPTPQAILVYAETLPRPIWLNS